MYRRNSSARAASSAADPYADFFSLADSSSRVSFLHRPPGQSTLRRHDSVSSLNTEGSFYQAGCLDNIPDRLEDEIEYDDENQWPGGQDVENNSNDASDGDEANSESEDNSTVYGSVYSRANTPSIASAYGGNEEYQSGWDSDTLGQGTPREHTPTPAKIEYLEYYYSTTNPNQVAEHLRPAEPISPKTPYKTRSGQIPGSYVGKQATPKRRGGGESISASPYSKKGAGKKGRK